MKKTTLKGWKPHIIKQLAMLMAICYLLHPLHQQFKTVFHEITHALEAPSNFLKHGSDSKYSSMHRVQNHKFAQSNHEHQLIEIWDTFFEKSSSKSSLETFLKKLKIDKHLTINSHWVSTIFEKTTQNEFRTDPKKLRDGYGQKQPYPPQKFFRYSC